MAAMAASWSPGSSSDLAGLSASAIAIFDLDMFRRDLEWEEELDLLWEIMTKGVYELWANIFMDKFWREIDHFVL